jgi:hypothetical protein
MRELVNREINRMIEIADGRAVIIFRASEATASGTRELA